MNHTISVVIPTYNRRDKVLRALDSVYAQTCRSEIIQVLVVDDGSTDGTKEAISSYQLLHPELPLEYIYQKNAGVSSARNTGMKAATGEYIAFLDSDDEWEPDKTKLQLALLEQNPEIDYLGGGTSDRALSIFWEKKPTLYRAKPVDLLITSFPDTSSILMKRSIFLELGGFDEQFKLFEDTEYWQRICFAGYGMYYYAKKIMVYDCGKSGFGEEGLSFDLGKMHHYSIMGLQKRRKEHHISAMTYFLFRSFYQLKYLRRILIVAMRKRRREHENRPS